MTAQDQINQFLGYMKNNSLPYNIVWIDIENTAKFFPMPQQNVQFLQDLINACQQYVPAQRIGIYASNAQWQPIMNGTTQFKNYKLWWARWDNKKDFSSYVEFGGWTQPYMKQYINDQTICCAYVDLDWLPDTHLDQWQQILEENSKNRQKISFLE